MFFLFLGIWGSIKVFLMIEDEGEEAALLEENKKVPHFLTTSFHYFSYIFGVIMLYNQVNLIQHGKL